MPLGGVATTAELDAVDQWLSCGAP
jgi:hypothetical protein